MVKGLYFAENVESVVPRAGTPGSKCLIQDRRVATIDSPAAVIAQASLTQRGCYGPTGRDLETPGVLCVATSARTVAFTLRETETKKREAGLAPASIVVA
jgi:hypothetical protein